MTLEHRFLAGLLDIKAVTLECKKCDGRFSVSPDKIMWEHLGNCPACGATWVSSAASTGGRHPSSELLHFLLLLAPVRKSQQDGADAEVDVRVLFEFDFPK